MIALLLKDFRLYRWAFRATIVILVSPYLLAILMAFYSLLSYSNRRDTGVPGFVLPLFSIFAAIVLSAIFGGSAFSIEHRDRSADFLALLPVTRWQILLSKCLVPIPALFTVWLIHSSIFFLAIYDRPNWLPFEFNPDIVAAFALSSAAMFFVFSVAWLAGLFLNSPAISACIALATLFAIGFFVSLQFDNRDSSIRPEPAFFLFTMVAGILCFLIGICCYVNRVSP
jgi:ABC-type transport system involved in multi-copper enzyme maturation permease subunit